jgi:hypothetical protein
MNAGRDKRDEGLVHFQRASTVVARVSSTGSLIMSKVMFTVG